MKLERYLEFFQEVLTMTDPKDKESIARGKELLKQLMEHGRRSGQNDHLTDEMMVRGYTDLGYCLRRKEDFACKPDDEEGNRAKRRRLAQYLYPGC